MPRTSAQAKRAREYGHEFERTIVNAVKARFVDRPWADTVRRSDQSHRAWLPDVAGWPALWPECETTDASHLNPIKKLEQGIRDAKAHGVGLVPVAITRRKGSPKIRATLRLCDLVLMLTGEDFSDDSLGDRPVELAFEDFCDLYDDARFDMTTHKMPEVPT